MSEDSDDSGPLTGRQPDRPGQPGRFKERPGDRDPETMDSRDDGDLADAPAGTPKGPGGSAGSE